MNRWEPTAEERRALLESTSRASLVLLVLTLVAMLGAMAVAVDVLA